MQKIEKLERDIATLQSLKCHIQNTECGHPRLQGKYEANTGNWDRNDDSYWISFKCPDCGKFWTEDQSELKYSRNTPDGYDNMVSKEGFAFIKESKY